MNFISLLYNIFAIPVLSILTTIIKPFTKKLKEREGMWEDALYSLDNITNNHNKRIWFHSASMGEFEQAKPVIELIKKNHPDIIIIVSFYSPSGYNNQMNYEFANAVLYMPFDSRWNASYFIKRINPNLAVFVRYETWRNHLELLKKKHIPLFLICATKPNSKILYSNYILKIFTRSNYQFYNRIYTVSDEHTQFFKELGLKNEIQTLSDTRFDRIIENVENAKKAKVLPETLFSNNDFVLVCGSTWEADEKIIIDALNIINGNGIINNPKFNNIRLIIVPHEPAEKHIKNLKTTVKNSELLSVIESFLDTNPNKKEISDFLGDKYIIVDSIGKLLKLYGNAHAAYVGGAFGVGVHSVTEPAGYGIPLSCGTNMIKSPDAISLKSLGGLKIVNEVNDLVEWLKEIINDDDIYKNISEVNKNYIYKGLGSSKLIAKEIIKEILLKNQS